MEPKRFNAHVRVRVLRELRAVWAEYGRRARVNDDAVSGAYCILCTFRTSVVLHVTRDCTGVHVHNGASVAAAQPKAPWYGDAKQENLGCVCVFSFSSVSSATTPRFPGAGASPFPPLARASDCPLLLASRFRAELEKREE